MEKNSGCSVSFLATPISQVSFCKYLAPVADEMELPGVFERVGSQIMRIIFTLSRYWFMKNVVVGRYVILILAYS